MDNPEELVRNAEAAYLSARVHHSRGPRSEVGVLGRPMARRLSHRVDGPRATAGRSLLAGRLAWIATERVARRPGW